MNLFKFKQKILLIAFAFACFELSPAALAVTPPPDGGYPNGNTAEGQNALQNTLNGDMQSIQSLIHKEQPV